MKLLIAVIAVMMAVTTSAETWRQKVQRLENEKRTLKTQVASLTKQVIKLQKKNNELLGDSEVSDEEPQKPKLTSEQQKQVNRYKKLIADKEADLVKLIKEQKKVSDLLRTRYSMATKSKREKKRELEAENNRLKRKITGANNFIKLYNYRIDKIKN
jgi:chromosome segregation ATPase